MVTIDYLHIIMALVFFIAAYRKYELGEFAHFFVRLINALWFTLTVINHHMPVEFVRHLSSTLIILYVGVEIIYPNLQRYWRKQ